MPELVLRTEIAAPIDRCFALSLSVDAHTSSMRTSGERVVAGVASGEMALGDTVTWQARHFGLPFRMTSKITQYEKPTRFVDEQTKGPFARWWHQHRFEASNDRTVMTDVVRFQSPAGPLGRLVDRILLERYLARLLTARNDWLRQELERANACSQPFGFLSASGAEGVSNCGGDLNGTVGGVAAGIWNPEGPAVRCHKNQVHRNRRFIPRP